MAKKTTKPSAKAAASAELKGILPKGEGAQIKRAFHLRMSNAGATNLPEFPEAACLTVAELRAFLNEVEKTVNPNPAKPVPANEIGVAIVPAFRKNKVTIMLVATRFTEDKATQKVLTINNPITGIHGLAAQTAQQLAKTAKKSMKKAAGDEDDPNEPPVGELALDTISTKP